MGPIQFHLFANRVQPGWAFGGGRDGETARGGRGLGCGFDRRDAHAAAALYHDDAINA